MNRRLSASRRLISALTALVTVWCMSCATFEPLMAGLVGASRSMACGSDVTPLTSSAELTIADANALDIQRSQSIISEGQQETDGFACACQSCTVTAPAQASVALSASPISPTPVFLMLSLAEITRAPLVPPPQLRTGRA